MRGAQQEKRLDGRFVLLAEDLILEPSGSRFKSYTSTLTYRDFITNAGNQLSELGEGGGGIIRQQVALEHYPMGNAP